MKGDFFIFVVDIVVIFLFKVMGEIVKLVVGLFIVKEV